MRRKLVTGLVASALTQPLILASCIGMNQPEQGPVDSVGPRAATRPSADYGDSVDHVRPLPGKQPNVLLIVTDDQRQEPLATMPATRKWFKASGVTYRNAFVTTPLCCPSRASIMTGRYAHNHGVWNNRSARRLAQDTTLQHRLQTAGFRTALVGKFLNGWPVGKDPDNFHRWAVSDPKKPTGYYNESFNLNGRMRKVAGYTTNVISRKSKLFLDVFERRDSSPWFLLVAPFGPHEPYTPEAEYRAS